MISTKQRSYLRSLANNIDPIFQVGKGGIEENFFKASRSSFRSKRVN